MTGEHVKPTIGRSICAQRGSARDCEKQGEVVRSSLQCFTRCEIQGRGQSDAFYLKCFPKNRTKQDHCSFSFFLLESLLLMSSGEAHFTSQCVLINKQANEKSEYKLKFGAAFFDAGGSGRINKQNGALK